MGNWFSRGNNYNKVQEDIGEIDNLLNSYDNRLSICETDVITCKSKLCEMTKKLKADSEKPSLISNKDFEKRLRSLEVENNRLKLVLENSLKYQNTIEEQVSNLVEKKLEEKEKWQFDLMSKYMEITDDFDKFKKKFVKESEHLAKSGKIIDDDITNHYTALCYICYKINSNILESYLK